ncbi:MAG: SpoIVB peptidase [Thermoanaerobacteraceae bacterium]|nr:SpoIVB peptidase [Thermoanaerobacteraceae bacterium]
MNKQKISKILAVFLIFLLVFIDYAFPLRYINDMPDEIRVIEGSQQSFDFKLPKVIKINFDTSVVQLKNEPLTINTLKEGKSDLEFYLFGLLPLKRVTLNIVPGVYVIPGGEPIGVKVKTKGVMVVGLSEVIGIDDRVYKPARDAEIRTGDIIVSLDGHDVNSADDITRWLNQAGDKKISVLIERNDRILEKWIKPVKAKEDENFRIGLWVKDHTAGIGTLTFVTEDNKMFGALGHPITDSSTGEIMSLSEGEIYRTEITSIEEGKKNKPGEIRGVFKDESSPLGYIEKNTPFGIYGYINGVKENSSMIPVALQSEVRPGPAKILIDLDNSGIKSYNVEIQKTTVQSIPSSKSMIIKVTDKELLDRTGGIVQGMSGSPIVQDGKLVGAVTHVFVNDPTKGYGVYIEWMMSEVETDKYKAVSG